MSKSCIRVSALSILWGPGVIWSTCPSDYVRGNYTDRTFLLFSPFFCLLSFDSLTSDVSPNPVLLLASGDPALYWFCGLLAISICEFSGLLSFRSPSLILLGGLLPDSLISAGGWCLQCTSSSPSSAMLGFGRVTMCVVLSSSLCFQLVAVKLNLSISGIFQTLLN